ncbi:hypothetical protein E2C01_070907 [Portunus trituberculatus]|uniref:Uncharacterized protein n=1 Tax=Portunus trituberculatus TaxID=210409 RepID=A0A5B7HYL4_PORTR|nr:hypothetical protein [Portunus trituberculatus]
MYNLHKKQVLTLKLQNYWECTRRKACILFYNDSRPSSTSWAMAQVGGHALSTSTACRLLWRKATSRGASRDHPRR